MGFPYIPEAVFSFFCQTVNKHLHFSHIEVTLIIKGNQFVGFDSVACCVYNFYSGTLYTTGITKFWPLPLEQ